VEWGALPEKERLWVAFRCALLLVPYLFFLFVMKRARVGFGRRRPVVRVVKHTNLTKGEE
jgi:uncharacterized RDD family membrane protein YckC